MTRRDLADRFIDRLDFGDCGAETCWLWTGKRNRRGYGQVRVGRRVVLAHRAAWELWSGAAPPVGSHVLHTCDTPACVRPDHLWLGTHQENMADMARKGRSPHGERNRAAKLTEAAVRDIRASAGVTRTELARRHGVSIALVSQVARGLLWRRVPLEKGAAQARGAT